MSSLPSLPEGWVQQYDSQAQHPFWVDTRAQPPRSSWVHPYHDEQFLSEHPDIREKIAAARSNRPPSDAPPAYSPRRNSFSGPSSNLSAPMETRNALSQPGTPPSNGTKQHRGFMAKLKDKASGMSNQSQGNDRGLFGHHHQSQQPYGYGAQSYGQPQYAQSAYGPPQGDPFAVSGGRYGRWGGGSGGGLGGRLGGGGMAMPLLGGMAGGLILGDLLDDHRGGLFGGPGYGSGFGDPFGGGFGGGYGGGFGGPFDNGFGGGGFGGGGFGGGGFGDFGGGGFGGGGFDNGGFGGGFGGGW